MLRSRLNVLKDSEQGFNRETTFNSCQFPLDFWLFCHLSFFFYVVSGSRQTICFCLSVLSLVSSLLIEQGTNLDGQTNRQTYRLIISLLRHPLHQHNLGGKMSLWKAAQQWLQEVEVLWNIELPSVLNIILWQKDLRGHCCQMSSRKCAGPVQNEQIAWLGREYTLNHLWAFQAMHYTFAFIADKHTMMYFAGALQHED